jgi:hypothetical protein
MILAISMTVARALRRAGFPLAAAVLMYHAVDRALRIAAEKQERQRKRDEGQAR